MKAVKKDLSEKDLPEDHVNAFEKGAQSYAKKIIANFKDYEFVGFSWSLFFRLDPDTSYSTPASL